MQKKKSASIDPLKTDQPTRIFKYINTLF